MYEEENKLTLLIKEARTQYWEKTGKLPTAREIIVNLSKQEATL